MSNPEPTELNTNTDRPAPARAQLREWWAAALTGKTHISVPEIAHEAVSHFSRDSEFVARFWDAFGYDVLYDYGISLLSESRLRYDGDGGVYEEPDRWFERNFGGHVALSAATDEEWDEAIRRREEDIALAQARVQALRDMRKGIPVAGVRGVAWNVRAQEEPPPIEVVIHNSATERIVSAKEFYGGCPICQKPLTQDDDLTSHPDGCASCVSRYGRHLLKSVNDPFCYAMRLTSGDLFYFESARIDGDWVYLDVRNSHYDDFDGGVPSTKNPPFERGLQVHLSAIAWCADAPYGS